MTPPHTILVVEDNPITRKMIRVTLATEGYRVLEAPDGRTALARMVEGPPDLVLTDLVLPDMDGFELVTHLRAQPGGAEMPILACSGFLSRFEAARMSALGFTDFLMKPVEPSRLVRTVRAFLPLPGVGGEAPGTGRHVLAVDDDPIQRKLLRIHLDQLGFRVTTAADGAEALDQARRVPPDAILSDVLMPHLDGFQLSLAVRQVPRLARIPIVLVSANYLEEADRALARKVGASGLAARTPDCKEAIELLLDSLGARPPQLRGPAEALEQEHVHRMIRQLERQVAQNIGLIQRSAFQAAVLSMLATLSSGLAQRLNVEMAPQEVLASLLDVGGLSLGALFLHGPDGQLRLEAQYGYAAADTRDLENVCGHPELLQASALEGVPVTIPSAAIPPPTADDFLGRAGVKSALLVPLGTRGEPIGVLLLGSKLRDLADSDWRPFAQTVGGQISQTIALSRTFTRLTAAEEQYRALFEHALEGIYQSSPTGVLLLANPALAQILGYASPAELLATVGDRSTQLYVDPEHRAELLRQLEVHGAVSGFEGRVRRKDGRAIWISENARAVRDASGRVAYIEGRLEDISRRRQAEEVLRESEERFRNAFEESAIGMALQAIDGQYLRVNRALCEMLGYSAEELLAKTFHLIVHPEDRDVDVALARRMLAGEIPSYETEQRYVHKLGHEVWVLASVSLVHNAQGHPHYLVVQAQDITARKQAVAIQARLQAQLTQNEKLAAMGQLLAGVAHELNNPLSVVMGQAELLQDQAGPGPLGARVERIALAAERCVRIVNSFLSLARQRPPERTAVDLNQVVRGAMELLAYPLQVDGVDVRLDLAADLPALWADADQLHQVLINLLSNAQHALRGSPPPRHLAISSRAEAAGTRVVIEVADSGPGVPPGIRSRIFEPFFTTKRVGEGTGLGLPLCRGIVEEHGGTLTLESRPGAGAVFRIELPRQAPPAAGRTAAAAPAGPRVRGRRLLVVDDEEDVAGVLAEMLATDEHRVETARNGAEALDRLQAEAFDAIISDLRMPELDGPGLYREVERRHPALLGRFVFLTGDTLDARLAEFLTQTDVPTVKKPFSLEEVRAAIQRVLGSR